MPGHQVFLWLVKCVSDISLCHYLLNARRKLLKVTHPPLPHLDYLIDFEWTNYHTDERRLFKDYFTLMFLS